MEKSDPPEGEILLCATCGTPYDPDDDFCRKCGSPLSGRSLPAVRRDYQPAVWQPPLPLIVQGAAAVAAGTIAEILVRKLIARIFRPRSLLPILRRSNKKRSLELVPQSDEEMEPEAQIESETVVFRQVRLRRRRSQ
jgi:predicted amidophosphoribosyltransferase